jgi:hypothetical protein
MIRLLLIGLLLLPVPARGVIVSGELTGGLSLEAGGRFIEIANVDGLVIGSDNFDDNNLYAFNERQNVRSEDGIRTDLGRDIRPGEVVASHYIAYDPVKSSVEGAITFDAPIIGVAFETGTLDASDFLMNNNVLYQSPRARGLERNDAVAIAGDDLSTLVLSFVASSPGDFIRVFTELSQGAVERGISETAVPVPPAFFTFGFLAAGVLAHRRRKPEPIPVRA